ncbi:ABC transporter substrate-binding protein [bacterium]|nr:ABC transporter substrate-binding protein [bacterium]
MKRILFFVLVIALTIGLAAFAGGQKEEEPVVKEIVLSSWGGSYEENVIKAMVKPFEAETGIKVIVTSYPDFAKVKAMVDTGNIEWDVVDVEDAMFRRGLQEGLFEKLDYSIIDKKDLLPGAVHDYAVGIEFWAGGLCYNTEKYPGENHPKTWADFWNVDKFPGDRALFNIPYDMLEIALLADGVSMDKLYPLDVDRAFKSLDKIKPHVTVWWEKGAQPAQLMTDGEVDMTYAYTGRIANIINEGVPAGISFNQASVNIEWLVITKGSKKVKEAMQFIAFCTKAKPQAEFSAAMQYGPINRKAFEHIDPDVAAMLPTAPDYVDHIWMPDAVWRADHDDEIRERWNAWILE